MKTILRALAAALFAASLIALPALSASASNFPSYSPSITSFREWAGVQNTHYCVQAAGTRGAFAALHPCHNTGTYGWGLFSTPSGRYRAWGRIQSIAGGAHLCLQDPSGHAGLKLRFATCNGNDIGQAWLRVRVGGGHPGWAYENPASKCVARSGGIRNGAPVVAQGCGASFPLNMVWSFI